jgi:hypothetical protein
MRNNQNDQGDKTEGFEREGLEGEGRNGEGGCVGIITCLSLTEEACSGIIELNSNKRAPRFSC